MLASLCVILYSMMILEFWRRCCSVYRGSLSISRTISNQQNFIFMVIFCTIEQDCIIVAFSSNTI